MLTDMTSAIKQEFTYLPRHQKGTQTPIETLERKTGTCRDYAMLMIEAVRALGLAARFVSGYVYNPAGRRRRLGGGNTHAWVRVYLPGSGWVEFDPTNAIIGTSGLIRVADRARYLSGGSGIRDLVRISRQLHWHGGFRRRLTSSRRASHDQHAATTTRHGD